MKANRRGFLAALLTTPIAARLLPKRWFPANGCPGDGPYTGPYNVAQIVDIDPINRVVTFGEPITALLNRGDDVLVFTKTKTYALDDTFKISPAGAGRLRMLQPGDGVEPWQLGLKPEDLA
jgi:hypothetical protein